MDTTIKNQWSIIKDLDKHLNFYLRHAKKDDILVPRIQELLNIKKNS